MPLLDSPIGAPAPATGRRLWLRWLVLALVVIGLAITFVNLGFWQLDRLQQRRDGNQTVLDHEDSPVLEWTEVFGPVITDADQWQRVRVTGSFDADHQFVVRYRSGNAGTSGYEVVTPLLATDGRHLLVSRGFGVRPSGQDFPSTAPPPPTGQVTVVGYVRRNESGPTEATTPANGQVRLINAPAIGATLPYPVVDGYLGLLEVTPAQTGGLVPVEPPELTEGSHLSYAVQWFSFSVLAAVGLVLLIRSDIKGRRPPERQEAS